MREDRPKTTFVTDPAQLFGLLMSGKFEVKDWNFINEDVLYVSHQSTAAFPEANDTISVIIAAYVVCTFHAIVVVALPVLTWLLLQVYDVSGQVASAEIHGNGSRPPALFWLVIMSHQNV